MARARASRGASAVTGKSTGRMIMRHRHETFDEQALRNVAIPSVAAGPHKHELRRALMQELRGRSDAAAAGAVSNPSSAGSHGAHPWLPRLGYALGLIAAVGCVALVISTQWSGFFDRSNSAGATASTQQGFSAVIGIDSPRPPTDQAVALTDAIDRGDFELEQSLPNKVGGRLYLYRVKPTEGREILFGSDHIMPTDPVLRLKHAQELQQAIDLDRGHYIGERVNDFGTKVYRYRVDMSDGTVDEYGSDQEPDVSKRQRHEAELDRAMSQDRGEVCKTLAGPDGAVIYLLKVTLSDGTIKTYASPDKPKGR
jgi:hypothetical protein